MSLADFSIVACESVLGRASNAHSEKISILETHEYVVGNLHLPFSKKAFGGLSCATVWQEN